VEVMCLPSGYLPIGYTLCGGRGGGSGGGCLTSSLVSSACGSDSFPRLVNTWNYGFSFPIVAGCYDVSYG
jgi:hypothetical protein